MRTLDHVMRTLDHGDRKISKQKMLQMLLFSSPLAAFRYGQGERIDRFRRISLLLPEKKEKGDKLSSDFFPLRRRYRLPILGRRIRLPLPPPPSKGRESL
jgi:hypothetical protein